MHKHTSSGYTLVELLIVIAIIAILASMAFIGISDAQARARDTQRTTDINLLHTRLEEYYTDKGGYPNTISAALFPGLDPEAMIDPNGDPIEIRTPVASQADAKASPNPTGTPNDYSYIPYPASCGETTCRGYFLKSYTEKPTAPITNPYIRSGLNNN